MTVRIVHTADTHLRSSPRFPTQTPDDLFDAFSQALYLAKRQASGGKDAALVHTGDLFDTPGPRDSAIERVTGVINEIEANMSNPPSFLFIAGNHDARGSATPALDRIIDQTSAEYLTQRPTVLGSNDIALYGVHHHENDALRNGDLSFDPPPSNVPVALCLHGAVTKNRLQAHVRWQDPDFSVPDLRDLIPFDVTTLLCGHLHKPLWDSDLEPSLFYPGAPECVRENLKGHFPIVSLLTVTNYPDYSYDGTIERHGTQARPWIDFEFTVDQKTTPETIANEVYARWEEILHETYPDLKERYNLWYTKSGVKEPTVDVWLSSDDGAGVPEEFAEEVVETLENWGHTVRLGYETESSNWSKLNIITSS